VWPEHFAKAHGPLRPVVERVLRGFMRCGLVEHGCARLWCGTCRTSVLCPFSCRGRSFCLSCEKMKQLLWAEWLQKEVLEPVPHRHAALTMPRLHPHRHILVTDGAFSDEGAFHPLKTEDGEVVMKPFPDCLLARLVERHAISRGRRRRTSRDPRRGPGAVGRRGARDPG
jgi:hypothetical protein